MLGRAIRMTWRMWNYRPIRARLPWYQGGAVLLLSAGCCMNHTTQHSKSARATKAKDLLVFCSARQQKAEAVCTIVSCIHLQSVGLEGDKSRQRLSKYYVVESAKNSNKLLVSICLYFCLMDRDILWKEWTVGKGGTLPKSEYKNKYVIFSQKTRHKFFLQIPAHMDICSQGNYWPDLGFSGAAGPFSALKWHQTAGCTVGAGQTRSKHVLGAQWSAASREFGFFPLAKEVTFGGLLARSIIFLCSPHPLAAGRIYFFRSDVNTRAS